MASADTQKPWIVTNKMTKHLIGPVIQNRGGKKTGSKPKPPLESHSDIRNAFAFLRGDPELNDWITEKIGNVSVLESGDQADDLHELISIVNQTSA